MLLCWTLSLLGLASAATDPAILALYKQTFNGDGTYYGKGEGGTCSFPPPSLPPVAHDPKIKHLVALNAPQFLGSKACGMCFKVHGTGQGLGNDPIRGDFVVFVKDLCPECHAGSLDFADNGDGRWKIQIQAVQCPVGNSKIEYKFQGSNPYYLKLQIRNARIPAGHVRVKKGGQWNDMTHTIDGFWLHSGGGEHAFPLDLEITGANGEVLHDTIPRLANEAVIHGNGVQFSLDHSLPTA